MTIGEVLIFIYLIKQIIVPIEVIFRWMSTLPGSAASWERIAEILDIEEEKIKEENKSLSGASSVKFNNINFSYDIEKKPILNQVMLSLEKGKITILSGESGSGKTTLLKILIGLYQTDYDVLVDGKRRIHELSPDDTAFASLDRSVFPMSIYDNIVLGDGTISSDTVEDIFERLGFADWIRQLPDGIHTIIGDGISGGQKQVIANARAILSDRSILIFDEPFSALDIEKEEALVKVLQNLKSKHFLLLTTHRMQKDDFDDKMEIRL
jgi:ATP-binding cassette subfamily C protein